MSPPVTILLEVSLAKVDSVIDVLTTSILIAAIKGGLNVDPPPNQQNIDRFCFYLVGITDLQQATENQQERYLVCKEVFE